MASNGESMVQDRVLSSHRGATFTAFDVGANIGEWTRLLLTNPHAKDHLLRVHAFEPASLTFDRLAANLLPEFSDQLVVNRCALSDHIGSGVLYKVHELAGSNSLHGVAGTVDGLVPEAIELSTLDEYCRRSDISQIDLLKIDAEGHDRLVLGGAKELLKRGAIEVIQFEYNHRWIGARCYLKDAFDDLLPLGYGIGKVTPRAIEWYSEWHPELETFREGNYLAVLPAARAKFTALDWWHSVGSHG